LIAIDPDGLAGRATYLARVEALVAAMLADEGVRLPGARREQAHARAGSEGIDIPDALLAQIARLAA
jgi:(2R)-3-sulfolactate dehydrogenase (NADP+)